MARTVAIASSPPAAPRVWPVEPLVEEMYIFLATSSPVGSGGWVVEIETVRMSYCGLWVGGWVGGWVVESMTR